MSKNNHVKQEERQKIEFFVGFVGFVGLVCCLVSSF